MKHSFLVSFSIFIAIIANVCWAANPIVVGYYPSWKRSKMNNMDLSKYTHINIAFGIPREDGSFSFEDEWALSQILKQIHNGGAKALLSVGGWTGSNYFSNILKNENAREKLLSSITDYVDKNELDGIDVDWEYPGRMGNTCNIVDGQNDANNFLAFLKDLRSRFESKFGERKRLITLAVRVQPFDNTSGPMDNVSEFSKYVDFANIMAYDIGGPWNADTGPNAPFNFEQGKGTPLSLVSSIDAWTKAGWPANQLVAGLAFYGRSAYAQENMIRSEDSISNNQYQPQSHNVPRGDSEDAPWYDSCSKITSTSGTWQWKHMRDEGLLVRPDVASKDWIRQWDNVSKTPWLFNANTKIFLSYDDPDSIRIKSDYAAEKGLAGVMIWSINMDYNGELIDAARSFGGKHGYSNSTTTPTSSSLSTSTPAKSTSTSEKETSHPAEPTNENESDRLVSQACTERNKYQCMDGRGKSSSFIVCVGGRWVAQSCAPGTVCIQLGNSVMCGWPTFKKLLQNITSLSHMKDK